MNTKLTTIATLLMSLNLHAIDLRIDNVKIYQNENQKFSEPSRLYIENNKIIKLSPMDQAPKIADKIIDANAQYAVPGLIDLHVHLGASGSNYGVEFQYLPVESHFNSNLYLGITNIVDLFSFDNTLSEAKSLSYQTITPNLFYAGALFTNPGGHGTQFGGAALEVISDESIDTLWQEHIAKKPNVTKAVIETFGGHGASLTDNQLTQLGKRSKEAGLPYFVHVSTLQDGKRAIKAGATALAHGINSELIDDEFIQLMVDNKVAYIPTLAVYHNHNEERESKYVSSQTHLLKTVHNKLKHCLFTQVPEPTIWKNQVWKKRNIAYNNVITLHKAGVVIGTGSDAGNPYTLHGAGLHNEIQALSKAGLKPGHIINAATSEAAEVINQENIIGQLKPGFEASFILLANNPIKDISNLSAINTVYKSGKLVNRPELITKNTAIAPQGEKCHTQVGTANKAAKVIDDFKGEIKWQAISDKMMGGQSSSQINLVRDELIIQTELGKPTGFGAWAGTQLMFNKPIDASDYQGIKVIFKGSDIPFGISVYHSEVKDWDHFYTNIQPSTQWQTVEIPFNQLKQFGYGAKKQWSAKNLSGLSFVWRTMPNTKLSHKGNKIQVREISYF
ncbi:amidohydrolase [Pseudoalteromonas sp. NBT06-2]|uniref:CIA30 family protein n=1 Tax=Pseudoalteromonas sp. NBT06-2 TaxID=2025950 RepID=UPI000BA5AF48|nr:CIA30 family protein [Pseudoalteromonas sp. NBT06-2]PAJ72477.1 amidohydrolase [Pseudoalteromonas sp. NBT06-2]